MKRMVSKPLPLYEQMRKNFLRLLRSRAKFRQGQTLATQAKVSASSCANAAKTIEGTSRVLALI